jgi:hypothetical protein
METVVIVSSGTGHDRMNDKVTALMEWSVIVVSILLLVAAAWAPRDHHATGKQAPGSAQQTDQSEHLYVAVR